MEVVLGTVFLTGRLQLSLNGFFYAYSTLKSEGREVCV